MTNDNDTLGTLVEQIAALGAARTAVIDHDSTVVPALLVPDGYKVETLEHLMPRPVATRTKIEVHDLESFTTYVDTYEQDGTIVKVNDDIDEPSITATIDYHKKNLPAWAAHKVYYPLEHPPAWEYWISGNKRKMSQTDFCDWIEDGLADIQEPDAASIIEACQNLQVQRDVRFHSAVRLDSGAVQFAFEEEDRGATTKGHVKFPESFVLGLQVFRRGKYYRVEAKIRYRIDPQTRRLTMFYSIARLNRIIEHAISEIVEELRLALPAGVPIYF